MLLLGAAAIAACESSAALEDQRVALLGKSGKYHRSAENPRVPLRAPEERKERGAALNKIKDEITAAIDAQKSRSLEALPS